MVGFRCFGTPSETVTLCRGSQRYWSSAWRGIANCRHSGSFQLRFRRKRAGLCQFLPGKNDFASSDVLLTTELFAWNRTVPTCNLNVIALGSNVDGSFVVGAAVRSQTQYCGEVVRVLMPAGHECFEG